MITRSNNTLRKKNEIKKWTHLIKKWTHLISVIVTREKYNSPTFNKGFIYLSLIAMPV